MAFLAASDRILNRSMSFLPVSSSGVSPGYIYTKDHIEILSKLPHPSAKQKQKQSLFKYIPQQCYSELKYTCGLRL